ncbi:hypothetical protein F3Y22_tig00116997pilonHSYRG00706 [Hibiscus syriacus]|uniref:Uncharacterized protein n=1 Tax=Hibiscus syriacus TaxID=106335 RepID=A0A6A2WLZ9_HIBSY|nr:hypothetical protein F3Y22_tig00116997pilonHSYRG00706 [Hibiscus syriacus]
MNGVDENAYSRVEGLMVEQKRTSCYDFMEQFCDCIVKHISVMQKQRNEVGSDGCWKRARMHWIGRDE